MENKGNLKEVKANWLKPQIYELNINLTKADCDGKTNATNDAIYATACGS